MYNPKGMSVCLVYLVRDLSRCLEGALEYTERDDGNLSNWRETTGEPNTQKQICLYAYNMFLADFLGGYRIKDPKLNTVTATRDPRLKSVPFFLFPFETKRRERIIRPSHNSHNSDTSTTYSSLPSSDPDVQIELISE
jgi:hypothetical protein